jgi:hypothetical protein
MDGISRRFKVVLAASLAVVLVAFVAVASAKLKSVGTSATLTFNAPDNFSGDVSVTGNKFCKRDRIVTVQSLGKDGTSPPTFVEAGKTDPVGHYEIPVVGGIEPGYFRAVVKKRIVRKRNLKCKPFVSAPQKFPSGS